MRVYELRDVMSTREVDDCMMSRLYLDVINHGLVRLTLLRMTFKGILSVVSIKRKRKPNSVLLSTTNKSIMEATEFF